MKTQKISTEFRETSGKGFARKLRSTGMVPAIVYGREEETLSISIEERELRKILSSNWETAIVDLSIKGKIKKECNAIIKDIQQHPATGKVLHVDFQTIHKGEKLRLDVPVSITGEPIGVKDHGGILEHVARVLAIRCMPRHIPESIPIDVSELGIQDAIHLRDVVERYPDLEFLDELDSTLVIVVPPKVEAEPTPEEELEAAEGEEEPEVIAKGKEEKEGSDEESKEESS